MKRYNNRVGKVMDTRVLSLLVLSLVLISPTFALNAYTVFGIYGSNNSMVYNSTFTNYGWVNGSQICTPANGLCNSTSSPGGSGYNTADGAWIYNGTSGLTFNQTTGNTTYQKKITNNCTSDDFIKGVYSNGTPICQTPTDTNTIYDDTALQNRVTSVNNSISSLGNATAVNATLQTEISNRQTNDTNLQNQINSLNSTKLNITDQRYNDTSLINAVNTSANIKALGFNLTTELKTYFDTLYYAASNPSSFISMATALAGLGNWSADKPSYYNTTQIDNSTILRSSSGLVNTTQLDNNSIIRSGNISWIKANQYTYNNLSITDITSAIGNATALDNASIIRSGNTSWIKTNQYTYNNLSLTDIKTALGNATAVNTTSNIQSLGFNTTTQLTVLFINSTAFDNSSIIRSGNTSWIKSNQYTYNNLSISDILSALGNATAVNATLQTELTNRANNDTALGNRIDSVNGTSVGKASPGNCGVGQFVMNTTTGGVQCATPSGSVDTNDTSRVDSLNSTVGGLYTNVTNLQSSNTTIFSRVDAINSSDISRGNWTADKSGYINTTQLDNNTIIRSVSGLINTTQFDNSTIIRSLTGYYTNYLNFTTYVNGAHLCTWNATATKFECLTDIPVDTNCSGADSCSGLVYDHNTSWVKSNQYTYNNLSLADVVAGVGNATLQYANSSLWSADKAGVVANASRYYGSNTTLILSTNTTWPIGTFTGGSAANVNITGKNLTVNCINFDSGGNICSLS